MKSVELGSILRNISYKAIAEEQEYWSDFDKTLLDGLDEFNTLNKRII
jgi:hypothetical protein